MSGKRSVRTPCLNTKCVLLICQKQLLKKPSDVSFFFFFINFFLVIHKVHQGKKLDKDAALAIHKELNTHPELLDEQAGWHVIVGKSYASAVTYNTKNMLFFDLLGDVNKSFLIFKTQ